MDDVQPTSHTGMHARTHPCMHMHTHTHTHTHYTFVIELMCVHTTEKEQ